MSQQSDNKTDGSRDDKTGSRSSHEITRRLLDSAVKEFGDNGLKGARVSDIARQCGLTSGAVYSRWPHKRDLFLAAIDHVMPQRIMFQINSQDLSAVDKLAELGANLLSGNCDEFQDLIIEACVVARRDLSLSDNVARSLSAEAEVVASIVSDGKSTGAIDDSLCTKAIVLCCQALYLGAGLAMSADPEGERKPGPDEWMEVLARFIDALARRS